MLIAIAGLVGAIAGAAAGAALIAAVDRAHRRAYWREIEEQQTRNGHALAELIARHRGATR